MRDHSDASSISARLTIDLNALADNWRTIAAIAPTAETSAVVKANAYGIGVGPAVRALAAAGCRTFFVATAAEGENVRVAAPAATIYVLDGLIAGSADRLAATNLRPVLGSADEIAEWVNWRRAGGQVQPAVHIDTGMNRLGLSADEARSLAADRDTTATLKPALIMSHLACANEPDRPMNRRQRDAFAEMAPLFHGVSASLANSAGIMLGPDYQFDVTRPGIALYGARAVRGWPALKTVVTAEARVLQIREATAGAVVGYGARQTLKRDSRLAVLGIGYADGYLRASGSTDNKEGANVIVRGHAAPLVGRISMDLMVADVTEIDGARRGDWVELFGPRLAIDDVAARAGTIGYELLTSLGDRHVRSYVGLG